MLHHTRSVDEFAKQFMVLLCHDPSITKPQQIQLFITGLGDPLRLDVTLQQPSLMDDAVIFARAYEQRLAAWDMGPQPSARGAGRVGARTTSLPSTTRTSSSIRMQANTSKPASVLRLSPAEITQRRKDNKCFHCNVFFTNGHKQQCKQLFMLEVLDANEEDADQWQTTPEPTISITALIGIQLRTCRTMHVFVTIHGTVLHALLDSGSTHNFVDSEAAAHGGIIFNRQIGMRVAVANGDRVVSTSFCNDLKITIADGVFTIE
jgi:hypothetical protein